MRDEHAIYLRPRERLMNSGVASLDTQELMQLIIGSGSRAASVAQLANAVIQSSYHEATTYNTLMKIPGLGVATACRILAAIEYVHRCRS